MAGSAGYGANAFVNGFMQAWDHIDQMNAREDDRKRQNELLDLQKQQIGLSGAGTWSAPVKGIDPATGKLAYFSTNNRTNEVKGLAAFAPVPDKPKFGIATLEDHGKKLGYITADGLPVGDPIATSPVQRAVTETWSSPSTEIDPTTGDAQVVRYSNRTPDARFVIPNARPATTAAGKSMPVGAQKSEDNDLEMLNTASGINTDLLGFRKQLEHGDLHLGPMANIESRVKNFAGYSDPQSTNYASFRAALEKMRNDSLRLNKGVQTEGDAVRAWNELFANLNDPKVVGQRLDEIAKINARATSFYDKRIQSRRRSFRQEALDTSPFYVDQSAYDGGYAPAQPNESASPAQGGAKDYSHLWR